MTQEAWHPVMEEPQHPLAVLEGKPLGEDRVTVRLGPENRVGARYFQILVQGPRSGVRRSPAMVGLFHQGLRPSHNWIEVVSTALPREQEDELFARLAELIPPGGHIMVEYESPGRSDTEQALSQGVPPLLTSLGYLLFQAGFRGGFKDWYISEGGSEGPRKLQAYQALDADHATAKARELAQEAQQFLARPASKDSPELTSAAAERARALLEGPLGG